jgi:hypothetical protein
VHLAIHNHKVLRGTAEPIGRKPQQSLACGCGGLPDLHAATHDAATSGRGSLVRREVGVALDQVDPLDVDAEFLGRHLPNGDAQTLAEVNFAAEHGD